MRACIEIQKSKISPSIKSIKSSIQAMKRSASLALIETFFERQPQCLIQIHAFLLELSFFNNINTTSALHDNLKLNAFSSNDTVHKSFFVKYENVVNKSNFWPLLSIVLSILSSSYALYSHFRESRKFYYLDEIMHLKSGSSDKYYFELGYKTKFSLFIIELLNVLTRTLLITIYFQILLTLPIHLAYKCLLAILFLIKPVLFICSTADFYVKKNDSSKSNSFTYYFINYSIVFFQIVTCYPITIHHRVILRCIIVFFQIFLDIVLFMAIFCIGFLLKSLDRKDLLIFLFMLIALVICYFLSNLIQFFVFSFKNFEPLEFWSLLENNSKSTTFLDDWDSKFPTIPTLNSTNINALVKDSKYIFGLEKRSILIIELNTFSSFTNLKYLHLGKNQLTIIKKGMFNGLSNLVLLDLGNNKINFIEEDSFSDLTQLTELNLSHNFLSCVSNALSGLKNLIELNMSFNLLTELNDETLNSLVELKYANFSNNSIQKVEKDCFIKMLQLKKISLHNNKLTSFQINLDNLKHLKEVTLYENNLSSLFLKNLNRKLKRSILISEKKKAKK